MSPDSSVHQLFRSQNLVAVVLVIATMLINCCAYAQSGASFQGLGDLPGGMFWSSASAVSADGSVVVGGSLVAGDGFRYRAFRWSAADGLQSLGNLPGPGNYSYANSVSGDGLVVVGESDIGTDPFQSQAFRWTAADGLVALAHLPPGVPHNVNRYGGAWAISGDGGVIVGYCDVDPPNANESFTGARWTSPASPLEMAATVGGSWIHTAIDVSADGLVVVGEGTPVGPGFTHAVRWTATGGPLILQWFPGHQAYFTTVSADGQVIAGVAFNAANYPEAVRWTALGSFQPLGMLPGATHSYAWGISSDGSKIVGYSEYPEKAFIWDARNNMRNLQAVLIDAGVNLTGWTLQRANAISDDGTTIVGVGINPSGQTEAWVARLPSPDTDGDGLSDDWEVNGIPYTDSFGAEQRYTLSFDGDITPDCDVNRKDIFVEIDAMNGVAPTEANFNSVKAAFNAAPVTNPNGAANGIKLHITLDETNIPTGDWTQDDTNGNGEEDWPTEFDALKLSATSGTTLAGYFGTHIERNDPDGAGIRAARAKAFRYCIFGRSMDAVSGTTGPSGIAEIGGNDFAVTLGFWENQGSPAQRASTFMHELGHTLGLRHGGGDDINYKPNYYSVMNYAYQMPQDWMLPGTWPLEPGNPGYSTFALPTLNENALNECAAQVTPGSALAGSIFMSSYVEGDVVNQWYGRYDLIIDWNNSHGECRDPIAVDINRLPIMRGQPAPDASPGETLIGHDDWAALDLNFLDSPAFAAGVHNSELGESAVIDITYEEYLAIANALPPFCVGDVVSDRSVDVDDLLAVINAWGPCPNGSLADIAPTPANGQVNVDDLLRVINNWGICP